MSRRGERRRRRVLGLVALLALLAGAITWFVTDQREQEEAVELERAVEAFAAASAELDHATTELNTEVARAQAVAAEVAEHEEASEELGAQVAALEGIIIDADEAVTAAAALDTAGTGGATSAAQITALAQEKSVAAAGIREITERVVTAHETLAADLEGIRIAVARADLDRARSELAALVGTATTTYETSEGKVADDVVREELAAALDTATRVLREPIAVTEAALVRQTERTDAAHEALTAATTAVVEAQRAWEDAEAERLATLEETD